MIFTTIMRLLSTYIFREIFICNSDIRMEGCYTGIVVPQSEVTVTGTATLFEGATVVS